MPDMKPVVKAKIIGTALNERGRPQIPAGFAAVLMHNVRKKDEKYQE